MNWKRYSNELMIITALFFAVGAFFYSYSQRSAVAEKKQRMTEELMTLQETVALKKIWADKRVAQKIDKIAKLVPQSKVNWQKNGKKVLATFHELKPSEVNKLVTTLLNIAVQIEKLKVSKQEKGYSVEILCKW